jgi:hypothetical protein
MYLISLTECFFRMEAADSLIKSLGSEKVRWSQQANEINETLQQAIGNSAVTSAFMSYVFFCFVFISFYS